MKHIATLYAKSSTNKIKMWQCQVTEDAQLFIKHGYIDGEQTESFKKIKGKNQGKSNATTDYEQAILEAESKMRKKMDEGYRTSQAELESAPTPKLPMLAHKFIERKHDIIWPAFASPKLDGNRLTVQTNLNKCIYTTRTGKEFAGDFSHLDEPIKEFIETVGIPDGEAYIHGLLLQDIVALTKKKRENSAEIEYWIFDIINTELPFDTRYQKIRSFFDTKNCLINNQGFRIYKNIVEVPNYEIKDEAELEQYHTNFIQLGFEGTMIRNKKGLYKPNYRSSDLLKKKDFLEEEFKIIGGKSAEGNDIGTVIFTCETPEGKPFDVRPKGTREQRKEWLENIDKLVNKVLTVRFQYYSKDKIPCHLRGICIRDYE